MFEFGGGGSTLWLLDRGASVVCVESDPQWHAELARTLGERVDLRLIPARASGSDAVPGAFFDDYVGAVRECLDSSLDLVIVDGRARVACGLAAMSKVKPGGMLLLDDSDRPRYAPLREALQSWQVADYRGLKPGGGPVCHTSVWQRPTNT